MVLREGTVDYGVAVQAPIFSLHTQSSISTGDFSDVFKFAGYLRSIGIGFHQVLPPFRLGIGDICPYSAVSLKALEPAYVSILRLVEKNNPFFNAERVLTYIRENKNIISKLNSTARVDYEGAMAFKYKVLRLAFEEFYSVYSKGTDTQETKAFRDFCQRHVKWLKDEYVPFMVIRDHQDSKYWKEWPAGLRDYDPRTVQAFMGRHQKEATFYRFEQWVTHTQWEEVIRECEEKHGVRIIEDIPYLPGMGASDVWANQEYYHLDFAAGAEPDQYALEGQYWGNHPRNLIKVTEDPTPFALPAILMAQRGVWAGRADHTWGLADPVRIPLDSDLMWKTDTKTGREIYNCIRYYGLDPEKYMPSARFMLGALQSSGMVIWGEDLGVEVPGIRRLMGELGIARMPVERWERDWPNAENGQPFIPPSSWPLLSFGCSSVHDSTNHPFHLHELMEPARYAPNAQARAELEAEATAYVEHMGWPRMPSPNEMNTPLYAATLMPILAGNSLLVSVALMDLWGLHTAYRDPEVARATRINVPGTQNAPHSTTNWNASAPDLPEIMEGSTRRAKDIADGTRRLLKEMGRGSL
ncbi:hypothetical protein A2276_00910 [candidate division WOR-1 bacterium RIFOXYA12_FULL_43_27]|nr:MAG: hypothetical protein A2276_00910 [candidate division WOR-1 bacterium RIFOXYA12_FULL_43_27]OGC20754.1 MAG: hypothetical protein A2292_06965 [candidate division WOR-1 bacterium RIFOXYB2_FULL_46_45]OGC31509.1 MAG: hypothetical protein A2232_04485 [candidate division WOR-1 bacterium RIFOXYA2_FULL_46_56]